jgi:hypothetical protein
MSNCAWGSMLRSFKDLRLCQRAGRSEVVYISCQSTVTEMKLAHLIIQLPRNSYDAHMMINNPID